jgi:periplasmic protein TonB
MPPVVREAKLVRNLPPEYPADAARSGKQGSVEIAFLVTPDGRIAEPTVVTSSDRVFERPALAAVRRWRYDPRIEDGKPVEWRTTVRIEFKLDEN